MSNFEISLTLPNLEQIMDKLGQAPEVLKNELNNAIAKSLKAVWAESWTRTPWKTNLLRSTYKSWQDQNNMIGFLTPTRDYALEQHENLNFRHPRGGEAKYLLNSVTARQEEIKRYFSEAIDNTINKITS